MRDFDDNEFPLAYLITFRCYGTWLHGDARGSVDPRHNVFGAPKIAANQRLENANRKQLKNAPVVLDARQRKVVERAVRAVCDYRDYVLLALNVRTNHVHGVVTAMCKPEPVLDTFKAYATRALRGAGLIGLKTKPWARHGSTVYLWKEEDVAKAIEYVTRVRVRSWMISSASVSERVHEGGDKRGTRSLTVAPLSRSRHCTSEGKMWASWRGERLLRWG